MRRSRKGSFDTNSSQVHALSVVTNDDYEAWKEGRSDKKYLYIDYVWFDRGSDWDKLFKNQVKEKYKIKAIFSVEEVKEFIRNNKEFGWCSDKEKEKLIAAIDEVEAGNGTLDFSSVPLADGTHEDFRSPLKELSHYGIHTYASYLEFAKGDEFSHIDCTLADAGMRGRKYSKLHAVGYRGFD